MVCDLMCLQFAIHAMGSGVHSGAPLPALAEDKHRAKNTEGHERCARGQVAQL